MFTWFPSQVYTATGPCSLGASERHIWGGNWSQPSSQSSLTVSIPWLESTLMQESNIGKGNCPLLQGGWGMASAEGRKEKTCSAPQLLLCSVGGADSTMDLGNNARRVVVGENSDSQQMGLQQICGEVQRASQLETGRGNSLQHLKWRIPSA